MFVGGFMNKKSIFYITIFIAVIIGTYWFFKFGLYDGGNKKTGNLPLNNNSFTIVKGGNDCREELTTIYEDDNYIYQVDNTCVLEYDIKYSNGLKIKLLDAIKKNKVTISELEKNGIKIIKTEKNKEVTWDIDKSNSTNCSDELIDIYSDDTYNYKITKCSAYNYLVVYSNGEKYTVIDAFNQGKVNLGDLESKGIVITKTEKVTYIKYQLKNESLGLTCSSVMTDIYEDSNYKYQVSSPCVANNYFVIINDTEKLSIKDALAQGRVSIDLLMNKGVKITKVSKNQTNPGTPSDNTSFKVVNESKNLSCASVVTTIYQDKYYSYTVASPCVANNFFVVFNNGDKYSVKDALNKKKVSVNDLINKGVNIRRTRLK